MVEFIHNIHKVIHNFHNYDVNKMEITVHYLSVFSEYIHNINSSVDKPVCKSEERYSLIFPRFCPLTHFNEGKNVMI